MSAETTVSTIEEVASELSSLRDRVADLEKENDELQDQVEELQSKNATLRDRLDDHELRLGQSSKKRDHLESQITELQSRELEKNAHLLAENVDPELVIVSEGRLEKFTKEDGEQHYRIPGADDTLAGTDAEVAHSMNDLLPIQQLARLDEDMLRANVSSKPAQLAVKLWQEREDGKAGSPMSPWKKGNGTEVIEWTHASEVITWIRRQEDGVSKSYAKKLTQRTFDSLHELSKHRLVKRKRKQLKNGLRYNETVIELRSDVELPGESTSVKRTSPGGDQGQSSSPVR